MIVGARWNCSNRLTCGNPLGIRAEQRSQSLNVSVALSGVVAESDLMRSKQPPHGCLVGREMAAPGGGQTCAPR